MRVCVFVWHRFGRNHSASIAMKKGSVSGKAKPFDGFMVNLLDAIKYTLLTQNRIIQRDSGMLQESQTGINR